MNETHMGEIERVLLNIEHAKQRATKAASELQKTGAEEHLVTALNQTADAIGMTHRRLMQNAYYHVNRETHS